MKNWKIVKTLFFMGISLFIMMGVAEQLNLKGISAGLMTAALECVLAAGLIGLVTIEK